MERERLINADVFEKFIKEKYADGEKAEDIKEQMLFDLSCQPIAYDVDAVVEQLDKASDYYEFDEQGMEHVQMLRLVDAIELVKGGGVDA